MDSGDHRQSFGRVQFRGGGIGEVMKVAAYAGILEDRAEHRFQFEVL